MFPTKGSEKEMTDTTETVVVSEVPVYVDSEGDELAVNSLVFVAEEVEHGRYDSVTGTFAPKRKFDFGQVLSLNEDGTVNVAWNQAQCGCNSDEASRVEKPQDLTVTTEREIELYYKGWDHGMDEGGDEFKSELLEFLNLPSASEIEALQEKAFELEQLNK